MQTQHISDSNSISITQVRKDIDTLVNLLNQYGEINVLKGRRIFFKAIDPDYEQKKRERIKKSVKSIKKFASEMAKKYPPKPGEKTLTEILIEQREKRRDPNYDLNY